MNKNLSAAEVDALIAAILRRLAAQTFFGMSGANQCAVVQATNDLQVIGGLLSRSMPLSRGEWGDKYRHT